jgi:UDP-glucose 4-epimerase
MADPAEDADINVVGAISVFSSAAACGARRIINTTTGGAIYGDDPPLPTPETAPSRPLSAYGLRKRTTDNPNDLRTDELITPLDMECQRQAAGYNAVHLRLTNAESVQNWQPGEPSAEPQLQVAARSLL